MYSSLPTSSWTPGRSWSSTLLWLFPVKNGIKRNHTTCRSFTLAPFTRDSLVENVATDPALNFLSSCRRSLLERSPRIVRTGEAHFPVEQTSQNTSTWVDFSKRKKSVCAPTLSKAILLNGTSSWILGRLYLPPFEEFLPLLLNLPPPPPLHLNRRSEKFEPE